MIDRDQTERAIIGALLVDPLRVGTMLGEAGVKSAWFASDDYAAIYAAAERALQQGRLETFDAIALGQEAAKFADDEKWKRPLEALASRRRVNFLTEAIDAACSLAQLDYHVSSLRALSSQAALKNAFQRAMSYYESDPAGSIQTLMDEAAKAYTRLSRQTSATKAEICTALEAAEAESYHQRVDPSGPKNLDWVPGLTAPWPELTRIYLGIGARFHIVAARPSVGKTSFAVNLIRYWCDQGVKVLINSLDMPGEDVVDRIRTEYSRVSIAKKRYTPTTENLEKLKAASAWLKSAPLEVVEMSHVEDFCLDLTMRAKTGKVDVAIVDYVQLLSAYAVNNANEYERVSYVAEYLKRTANRLKIPIVALCQLNRKGSKDDGAEPTLTDLRGSGALEQAASSVILLHREQPVVDKWRDDPPYWLYANEQYGRTVAGSSLDAVWAIVAKNQNGPTGKLPFVINKPYFAWKLADNNARPAEKVVGHGATERVEKDWRQSFERIHRDWRGDDWEKSLIGKVYPYPTSCGTVDVLI